MFKAAKATLRKDGNTIKDGRGMYEPGGRRQKINRRVTRLMYAFYAILSSHPFQLRSSRT